MAKKVTVRTLQKMKDNHEKISMLTAYDFSTAKYIDEAGIDIILVGDSLAMTALGYDSTNYIGIDEMMIFTKAVTRGAQRSFVVADMPFMSVDIDLPTALTNIGNMIKCGANAVKIEGCSDYIEKVVEASVNMGAPVMGHIGFTPQSHNVLGGFVIQGRTDEAAEEILKQAKKLEKAGVFAIVLEMVPEQVAKTVTENLKIPTISCGGGRFCDGSVMVCDDMFGKYGEFSPKFTRRYGDMRTFILDCVSRYNNDVKSCDYPNENEVY